MLALTLLEFSRMEFYFPDIAYIRLWNDEINLYSKKNVSDPNMITQLDARLGTVGGHTFYSSFALDIIIY